MIGRVLVVGAVVIALLPSVALAQTAGQDAALSAEGAGRWDEAIRANRAALEIEPQRADLWIRLSQTYAVAGDPKAALEAIQGALKLEPNAPEHLRARATLATWAADYRLAQDSYRRLAVVQPGDVEIGLAYARVSLWGGDIDEAVHSYRRYLDLRPDAADVWLELAKAESWRGNYAAAVEALEAYRGRFGASLAYSRELAAVMASGDRPDHAQEVLAPLMQRTPDSVELSVTRTVALAKQRRDGEAWASLDTVRRLAPDSRETRDTERVLRTLLASLAQVQVNVYADSDRLQTERVAPRATLSLSTGTRFSGGYDRALLDAQHGSGLEQVDGSTSARYEQAWASAAQKLGGLTLGGQLGFATANGRDLTTYAINADARVADSLQFLIERSEGFFVISPRTVGLGLTQLEHRVQVNWTPTLRYQVAADASYQELSDGNHRWEIMLAPRRSVARTAKLNLDLGISAYQLRAARDLDNGYYDPRRYEQYAATAYPYLKIRENIGLALMAAVGAQREATSPAFHFGGTLIGEATFGIYEPWVLKISSSATMNRRVDSGAYRGFGASAVLIRRF